MKKDIDKGKIFIIGTIILGIIMLGSFMYFMPVNFLKFITWLGKYEAVL